MKSLEDFYRLEKLLRFFRGLQTSRVHQSSIYAREAWTDSPITSKGVLQINMILSAF